jgi:cysteine synthase
MGYPFGCAYCNIWITDMAFIDAGNHAVALALAARTFDIPSFIVMPSIATPFKIEAHMEQQSYLVAPQAKSAKQWRNE